MKKVISFVLVLALVLGSFSMAFALTDVEGNDNEQAINVVNDLGIVTGYTDGSFQPEKAVTRAEFAAMITRALNIPESALAGYTTTTFKDTTGYGWAVKYLAFCNDKGIMLGDGNGNAMPGRTINVNEAMTMVLRAMGLTDNAATLVGSWPANYVTVAKNADLYDDVAAVTTVDRASAAQIIYNAIKAPGYVVNAEGQVSPAPSMLAGLGAVPNKEVVGEYDRETAIALADILGAYGTVYTNDGEIVAVDVESVFLSGEFTSGGALFEADDVEYRIDETTAGAFTVVNGALSGTATTGLPTSGEYTIAADVTGKVITEIYSVISWDIDGNSAVVYIEDEDVLEAFQEDLADDAPAIEGIAFELDKADEIVATSWTLAGVKSLDDVKVGNIVYVYGNGTNITKVEVGTETVKGVVTKLNSDSEYIINGTAYAVAADELNTTDLAVGAEGTAYLNYAGEIVVFEAEESEVGGNYAVYKAADVKTSFGEDTVQAKLFTIDGVDAVYTVDTDEVATLAGISGIVDYSLNKDGELEYITNAATTITNTALANNNKLFGTYKVASNVVVWVDDAEDGLYVGKITDLDDEAITISAIVDENVITHILVTDAELGGVAEESVGIVKSYGETVWDAENEETVTTAAIIIDGVAKDDVWTDVVLTTSTALVAFTVEDDVITDVTAAAVYSGTITATTIEAIDGTIVTYNDGAQKAIEIAEDVTVLVYDAEDDEWTIAKASAIKNKNNTSATFYDTVDDDETVYNVVVVVK